MPAETPYPNPFEILRYVLRCLDLKQSNKRLDDLASKSIYDPRELTRELEQSVPSTLEKYMGPVASDKISTGLSTFFDYYLQNIVGKTAADGVSRADVLGLLIRSCIKEHLVGLVTELNQELKAPHPSFWFSPRGNTVGATFAWLEEHQPGLTAYLASLSKENRDRISSWRNGNELPSAQSIKLLFPTNDPSETCSTSRNKDFAKTLLFMARAVDFIKRHELGEMLIDEARLSIWSAEEDIHPGIEIKRIQDQLLLTMGSKIHLIGKLQKVLKPNAIKTDISGHQETIKQVRTIIQASSKLLSTEYWIDWCDARWHVFSGELTEANRLYKESFEKGSFVAGDNLKHIIKEALVVAANQPKADIVFLKQLKWALINFGYDIPSASAPRPSNKVLDTIESWEIEQWKNALFQVFPKEGLYPGTDFDFKGDAIGPLIVTNPENIKPDYRNPDRTIKVGDTWKRPIPQIVWFSHNENIEICKRLIEKGADINVKSEVGDTPILMALEAMNLTEVPYRSLNQELFLLISSQPHEESTINTRTQKRRLLPIISAVKTGRPEIVDKILSMGANPNGRGQTDLQTPLMVCLKLIGTLKNPEKSNQQNKFMPSSAELLDAFRRHSHGIFGFILDEIQDSQAKIQQSPEFQNFKRLAIKYIHQRMSENMSLEEMRRIASLLIKAGADVNAEHSSPIKGYTPLMLATEHDEIDLFELMLVHGGDTAKTYIDPKSGRVVSINEIASYFDSRDIRLLMSRLAPTLNGKGKM